MFEGERVKDLKCARPTKIISHRDSLDSPLLVFVYPSVLYPFNSSTLMVYVTYNIPDTGLLALFAVRPLFLRAIYVIDKLFLFPDDSAVRFKAQRLTCSSSTYDHLSLDLPEKP